MWKGIVLRIARELHNVILDESTSVYVSAVLEYLTAEILELSGNATRDLASNIVVPHHIMLAIKGDGELSCSLKHIVIYQGGFLPPILASTRHNFWEHANEINSSRSQVTFCIDSLEMTECILGQLWSLRPGRNISQDALNKLQAATEEYVLTLLKNANHAHSEEYIANARRANVDRPVMSALQPEHVKAGYEAMVFSIACNKGDEAAARQLIAQGFDATKPFHDLNWHCLQGAIASGSLSTAKLLLGGGVDKTVINKAAIMTVCIGDVDAMELLLDHGLDINDLTDQSLLSKACTESVRFAGCLDVAELLVLRGAELEQSDLRILQPEQREKLEAAREAFVNPGLK